MPRTIKCKDQLILVFNEAGFKEYATACAVFLVGLSYILNFIQYESIIIKGALIFALAFMASELIDDKFEAVVTKAEVRVIRKRFWWTKSVKVGPSEKLAMLYIHEQDIGKKIGYQAQFEFLAEHGSYSIPSSDLFLLGQKNLEKLEAMEKELREFLGLRLPPREIQKLADIRHASRKKGKVTQK